MVTDSPRGRIDAGKPCTTAFAGVEGTTQGPQRTRHQLHKARVADERGAIRSQPRDDVVRVVMVAGPLMAPGTIDQDGHDLTESQARLAPTGAWASREEGPAIDGRKSLAESSAIAEPRNALRLVHSNPLV